MRKTRGPKGGKRAKGSPGAKVDPPLAAAGSLTRTKALLLAALRVWELKQRVSE
jgi:hypothetical protein